MYLLSELIAKQEQNERKWIEQIVRLSHVQEVMELLREWFDGHLRCFVDRNVHAGRYVGANSRFTVRYDAFNGYKIEMKNGNEYTFKDYTGVVEDDAAKIYEMVMKELM